MEGGLVRTYMYMYIHTHFSFNNCHNITPLFPHRKSLLFTLQLTLHHFTLHTYIHMRVSYLLHMYWTDQVCISDSRRKICI